MSHAFMKQNADSYDEDKTAWKHVTHYYSEKKRDDVEETKYIVWFFYFVQKSWTENKCPASYSSIYT